MRNTLLPRPLGDTTNIKSNPSVQTARPSIRLVAATPSATGLSVEASSSFNNNNSMSFESSSWGSFPSSVLAPKPDSTTNKRKIVPKKSKLGLLSVVGSRDKENRRLDENSRPARTANYDPNTSFGNEIEIFADSTIDPDIGEIIMIKKKKSRAALDGMRWGPLGGVTNIPASSKTADDNKTLKVKGDEKGGWWSIGRGRKDSKDKSKESKENPRGKSPESTMFPMRSKTPEPLKTGNDVRARFNSLDSGLLLGSPVTIVSPHVQTDEPEVTYSRSGTPTAGGFLAPPSISAANANGYNQGSIAVRAMRSVRSLARIGSWAQLSGTYNEKEKEKESKQDGEKKEKKSKKEKDEKTKEKKAKKTKEEKDEKAKEKKNKKTKEEKDEKTKEKKDKKSKKAKKEKEKQEKENEKDILRMSTSSFEAGTLSYVMPSNPLPTHANEGNQALKKKVSILGLGLPSSMRLPKLRTGSTASSVLATQMNHVQSRMRESSQQSMQNKLSLESGGIRARSGSVMSTISSLRPASTISNHSRNSMISGSSQNSHGNGSGCSVRWDEQGLQTVREVRRKEREEKAKDEKTKSKKDKKKKKSDKEKEEDSRRSSEGRKRIAITDIFPDIAGSRKSSGSYENGSRRSSLVGYTQEHAPPLLTVEEATNDGHGVPADYYEPLSEVPRIEIGTPNKKVRPRPVSEQMLGKSRPVPMYQDDEGVLSILDAATNDLAQLIMTLNLEATPCSTPNITPLRPSPNDGSVMDILPESPLSKTLRKSMASFSSLRPYAQSLRRSGSQLLLGSPKNTLKKKPSKSGPESLIGQQIAPWSKLVEGLSSKKSMTFSSSSADKATKDKAKLSPANISRPIIRQSVSPPGTFRKGHRRQMTPAPEPEPEPVFLPLRPAARPRTREKLIPPPTPASLPKSVNESLDSSLEVGRACVVTKNGAPTIRAAPSYMTFGTSSPAPSSKHKRKSSSSSSKVPIPPETRRVLGMSGTLGMGGSDLPAMYAVPEVDAASDPDSDIPDELQFILKASYSDGDTPFKRVAQALLDDDENDTFSFPTHEATTSPYGPSGWPPTGPLPTPSGRASSTPVFRAHVVDEDENHTGTFSVSERECTSEFDFTEELKKLDESAGSDRKSFVEQLETAFRTPAKVELDFDLLGKGLLNAVADTPTISKLPFAFPKNSVEEDEGQEDKEYSESTPVHPSSGFDSRSEMFKVSKLVDEKEPMMMTTTSGEASSGTKSVLDLCTSGSQILNMEEPSLLQTEDESVKLNKSTSTTSSNRSNGELNTSFKFGGLPKAQASPTNSERDRPLTLSDIIPSPSHARSLSESSFVLEDGEDSVLKSIYAKAKTGAIPQARSRVNSDASSKRKSRMSARSFLAQSRPTSMISFTGLDSFEEIRRTFEFGGPRPTLYPPASNSAGHRQRDSVLSISSVSSYGRVTNPGINDPFGFSLSRLQERPSSEEISSTTFSFSIDDTFSFLHHPSRRVRVDSDASSFYFRPPLPNKHSSWGSHRRQESCLSYISASGGPPISLYNRNFAAHRRSGSSASVSSTALSYAMHGVNGGRSSWAKHLSIDSVMSDVSALRLGRPGIGDKMFDMSHRMSGIILSPLESEQSSLLPHYVKSSSYEDSIIDASEEPKSTEDSLFDKTGSQPSVGMQSLFGANDSGISAGFLPHYRPVSVISIPGAYIPPQEDDTWISMIGGGHVRRNSVASNIQASPCARVEKRKGARFQPIGNFEQDQVSPNTIAKVVEIKPSTMSITSSHFGGERMVQASRGLLERQSLEDSCLIAEGEDSSLSFRSAPVFSRPVPAGRSRSSTCTSSSGGETPPLSSDGSSISGGSQSSIDLTQLDSLLANATFPVSNSGVLARTRTRPRARGQGHRRQYSAARASRTSVYETIEEEPVGDSPAHTVTSLKHTGPMTTVQPIMVVDSDTGSIDVTVSDSSFWDSERGVVALNKCYALRHEAEGIVDESKRQWMDTPFSIFAVQNFDPPRNPEGMKALLQHSVQHYGPLPSELRSRRRSRTYSRPSPYPLARVSRVFYPPEPTRAPSSPQAEQSTANTSVPKMPSMVLQDINVNSNVPPSPAPSFKFKALSPEKSSAVKRTAPFGQPPIRPRVASNTRRAALGWTKRNAKSSNGDQKENKENKENASYGSIKAPGESLRLNRPRPRGRATPAAQPRPIRV